MEIITTIGSFTTSQHNLPYILTSILDLWRIFDSIHFFNVTGLFHFDVELTKFQIIIISTTTKFICTHLIDSINSINKKDGKKRRCRSHRVRSCSARDSAMSRASWTDERMNGSIYLYWPALFHSKQIFLYAWQGAKCYKKSSGSHTNFRWPLTKPFKIKFSPK